MKLLLLIAILATLSLTRCAVNREMRKIDQVRLEFVKKESHNRFINGVMTSRFRYIYEDEHGEKFFDYEYHGLIWITGLAYFE